MTEERLLTVYFDGACHLCSREIAHYQRHPRARWIRFLDITNPEFSAEREGLDPVAVHKSFHVRTAAGEVIAGVGAFVEIWRVLEWKTAVRIAEIAWVRTAMEAGYSAFARLRPYLPRRSSANCEASPYCDLRSPQNGR